MEPIPTTEEAQPITKDQLIEMMKPIAEQIYREDMDADIDIERHVAVNATKRNILFVDGHHFIAPRIDNAGVADYAIIDSEGKDGQVNLAVSVNLVGSDCWKYVAVAGMRAPATQAVPDDEEDPDSISKAASADVCDRDLHRLWHADEKQQEIAYNQWVAGPSYIYTPFVTSKERYGVSVEPKIDIQDINGIPSPIVTGTTEYPKGDVECHILNCLRVRHQSGAKELADTPWLEYSYMEHRSVLLEMYPDNPLVQKLRPEEQKLGTNSAGQQSALLAQDAIKNPSTIGRPSRRNFWQFTRRWWRPTMYQLITDEAKRARLSQQCPAGSKWTYIGDDLVDIEPEGMDDVWAVAKVGRGPLILSNPLANDIVQINRALNDFYGLMIETCLRAIPKTGLDPAVWDRKAMIENDATPCEVVFTRPNASGDLSKSMAVLPTARFSDQMPAVGDKLRAIQQEIDGIQPSLYGGGPPTSTWRDAKQRKDQSMMQLAPGFSAMQRGWEKAKENGIRMRAKYGIGEIKAPGRDAEKTGKKVYDRARLEDLAADGWHCEAEENIPLSQADLVDRLTGLLQMQVPIIQQYLADPLNAENFFRMLGIRGFESADANVRRKVDQIIDELVNTPETQDIDPMTGAPVTVPPVMPDPLVDDVAKIAIVIREWLSTEAGLKLQQTDQQGFGRIRMYLQACVQILQAQMAPAVAPPGAMAGEPPAPEGQAPQPPPQPEATPEAQPQAA